MKNGTYRFQIELIAPLGIRNGDLEIYLTKTRLPGPFSFLAILVLSLMAAVRLEPLRPVGTKTLMYNLPSVA